MLRLLFGFTHIFYMARSGQCFKAYISEGQLIVKMGHPEQHLLSHTKQMTLTLLSMSRLLLETLQAKYNVLKIGIKYPSRISGSNTTLIRVGGHCDLYCFPLEDIVLPFCVDLFI